MSWNNGMTMFYGLMGGLFCSVIAEVLSSPYNTIIEYFGGMVFVGSIGLFILIDLEEAGRIDREYCACCDAYHQGKIRSGTCVDVYGKSWDEVKQEVNS